MRAHATATLVVNKLHSAPAQEICGVYHAPLHVAVWCALDDRDQSNNPNVYFM